MRRMGAYWLASFMFGILWLGPYAGTADAAQVPGPLVDTEWLASNLDGVVLLDVRADKESFEKKSKARMAGIQACGAKQSSGTSSLSGHIPGAMFIPWQQVRSDRKVGDVRLIGMLPTARNFERLMQRSGVDNDSAIVITTIGEGPGDVLAGTRLYWTLKYFGHGNVALLDGGTAKWVSEDRDVEYGRARLKKGNFKAGEPQEAVVATTDDVVKATGGDGTQLVDVRDPELYLGLAYNAAVVSPEGKGHIPGAKNYPVGLFANTMGPAGTFYSLDDLREAMAAMKVDPAKPTILYGETGGLSSLGWFAFHELLGNKNAKLYDGSMNEWASSKDRPVVSMKVE